MRLLVLFLLLSVVCQGQSLLSRTLTLSRQTGTVGEWLNELNHIPGIVLSYSSEIADLNRTVRPTGKESTLEDFLRTILKGQPVTFIEQDGKVFLIASGPLKKKITLSGYVTDKKSGERLIGASIFLPARGSGTTTNSYGFYSLTLYAEPAELQVTYTGYVPHVLTVDPAKDQELSVALEQSVVQNPVVVVRMEGKNSGQGRIADKTNISSTLIKSLPAMMGEPDVLKALQLLPGIQAGNEGTSGLNVRGGSADQNLILLDGVPVYNASHAFGLFSVFNADAVNHVEVLKGGFPASYGGRLSSVIDVHMKEGDRYGFHSEGGLGLVFSKLTLEGPLKKGRSSFLVSARRTYVDLLVRPLLRISGSGTDIIPFFSDVNMKFNFPAGKKDHFFFSVYRGEDKFRVKDRYSFGTDTGMVQVRFNTGFDWGNITAMARWNHIFSKKTFSNFTFTHSRYRFNSLEADERLSADNKTIFETRHEYFSGIQDWNLKGDLDFLPAPDHFIKTGFAATVHRYQPGVSKFFQKDSVVKFNRQVDNHSLYTGEYDAYAEDDIRLSPKMKLNAGLRFSAFTVRGKLFTTLQPRLNWLYKFSERWSMRASYSSMNQFIHLLTNSNLGLPTDLWLPVTDLVPPQRSHQVAAGLSFAQARKFEASMEVYYKALENVIDYREGAGFGTAFDNWEDMVESGTGTTYGAEWFFQKKQGPLTGLLSYTLSRSTRRFPTINEGKAFPYKYDRRHELKLATVWQPSPKFSCSANWLFSTGNAISLPVAYYYNPYTYQYVDIFEGRNNFRMPDYHRLDLSVKFIKQKKRYTRTWALNVYNLYNRFNPFFRYKAASLDNEIVFKEVSVLPFLPSVSYQFKF